MNVTKSYDFDHFSDADRQAEIKRLHRQAMIAIGLELGVLRELGLRSSDHFLEIGCGPGFVTGAIAEHVKKASGLDTSRELLDIARNVVAPARNNVAFHEASAYSTGLTDASFDFVYSRLVHQHLNDPRSALAEARRITRPGGRVCVADVDDAWLTLHPQCDAFDAFTKLAQEAQRRNGGDRFIGRKLPSLMQEVGFSHVDARVISVSSLEIGLMPFLDITTSFKAIQINDPQADEQLKAIRNFATHTPHVFGVVGVFVVAGTV